MQRSYPSQLEVDGSAGIRIRLTGTGDVDVVVEWLADERVFRWWGGAAIPFDEVRAKYDGRRAPDVVVYIIESSAGPAGLVQAWQSDGRYGLDMLLAPTAQGRGLGPQAARALAEELTGRGWRPLTADPAVANTHAVRAWCKAGFVPTGRRRIEDGHELFPLVYAPTG